MLPPVAGLARLQPAPLARRLEIGTVEDLPKGDFRPVHERHVVHVGGVGIGFVNRRAVAAVVPDVAVHITEKRTRLGGAVKGTVHHVHTRKAEREHVVAQVEVGVVLISAFANVVGPAFYKKLTQEASQAAHALTRCAGLPGLAPGRVGQLLVGPEGVKAHIGTRLETAGIGTHRFVGRLFEHGRSGRFHGNDLGDRIGTAAVGYVQLHLIAAGLQIQVQRVGVHAGITVTEVPVEICGVGTGQISEAHHRPVHAQLKISRRRFAHGHTTLESGGSPVFRDADLQRVVAGRSERLRVGRPGATR